jgi:putative CocE/NonD family hydrolase
VGSSAAADPGAAVEDGVSAPSPSIRHVKNVRIPVRDGSWLAADFFMPAGEGRYPAVIEYLPYRKDDLTVPTHHSQWYLAERGYVAARIDCRGTGASPGASFDEYTRQEQEDAYDACEWLARQDWCSVAVGAFGTSYGGYTSCQLAANRPPHLKAIAPMYGFDDHYTDDCHYHGGQLRMYDMGRYGNRMLATNALPPTPASVGPDWAAIWRERLKRSGSWLIEWLRHQTDGPYWKVGSIRDRVEEIECAVLLWGGWQDGYINPIFRMFPRLRGPKRAIIGPWMHTRPDRAIPGPQIDWLAEMVRWFDQWLKGEDTGVSSEPPVVLYMQRFDKPATNRRHTSGYWRYEQTLPCASTSTALALAEGGRLDTSGDVPEGTDALDYRPTLGVWGGEFSAGGLPDFGLPGDQRADAALSLVYTSDPLEEPLELIGNPQAILHVSATAPVALFSVKLCAVAPDGTSALVCKGALNATRRDSLETPEPLTPGETYELRIQLGATAWRFDPGHRIRLVIANSDFPNLWPTPFPCRTTVFRGAMQPSRIELPTVACGEPESAPTPFALPHPGSDKEVRSELVSPYQDITYHVLEGAVRARSGFVARATLQDGTQTTDRRELEMWASDDDPGRARAGGRTMITIEHGPDQVEVESTTWVTSTREVFNVTQHVTVSVGGGRFWERHWLETIPRHLM